MPGTPGWGTLVLVTLLSGLDAVDWATLNQAYGPAVAVPDLLRGLGSSDATRRSEALEELWGTIWHQGTVYDCTPVVVPFLAEIVQAADVDCRTRAEVALLLAEIASAASFVLDDDPRRIWSVGWRRDSGSESPARELDIECRAAVAGVLDRLGAAVTAAPPVVCAGLLAVFAAVAEHLPASVRTGLAALERGGDGRVAAAAQLTGDLASGRTITRDRLVELAAVDVDALDWVSGGADGPLEVQAVGLVIELVSGSISGRSAA